MAKVILKAFLLLFVIFIIGAIIWLNDKDDEPPGNEPPGNEPIGPPQLVMHSNKKWSNFIESFPGTESDSVTRCQNNTDCIGVNVYSWGNHLFKLGEMTNDSSYTTWIKSPARTSLAQTDGSLNIQPSGNILQGVYSIGYTVSEQTEDDILNQCLQDTKCDVIVHDKSVPDTYKRYQNNMLGTTSSTMKAYIKQ